MFDYKSIMPDTIRQTMLDGMRAKALGEQMASVTRAAGATSSTTKAAHGSGVGFWGLVAGVAVVAAVSLLSKSSAPPSESDSKATTKPEDAEAMRDKP
jgi:hypothetical protein